MVSLGFDRPEKPSDKKGQRCGHCAETIPLIWLEIVGATE